MLPIPNIQYFYSLDKAYIEIPCCSSVIQLHRIDIQVSISIKNISSLKKW